MKRWLLIAACVAAACIAIALLEEFTPWYPLSTQPYFQVAVLCGLTAILTPLFPRSALVAMTLIVCSPWWRFSEIEIRLIPLALTGWLATLSGCRLRFALPFLSLGVIITCLDNPGMLEWIVTGGAWADGYYFGSIINYFAGGLRGDLGLKVLAAAVTFVAVLLGRTSYRQRLTTEALEQRNEELQLLREREAERLLIQERATIAREVHDVVAHHVAAMVVRAQAAVRVADSRPEELLGAAEGIAESGQHALQSMRQVVRVLRGTDRAGELDAPRPVEEEINAAVSRVRLAGMDTAVQGEVPRWLDVSQRAVLLRVCQESLTNALLHAGQTVVRVRLEDAANGLRLTVQDEGLRAGAERMVRAGSGGFGVAGMRERAAAIGGTLQAGPYGTGWRVELMIPRMRRGEDAV